MASGAEHYQESERLLARAVAVVGPATPVMVVDALTALAHAHAVLALAAASARTSIARGGGQ